MALFFKLDAFSDATWASIQLMSWTVAEPGVILICACMPALWPLVGHYKKSGISKKSTYGTRHSERAGIQSSGSHAWPGHHHSRNFVHANEEFFPLSDIEGMGAPHEFTSSKISQTEAIESQHGIKVTKEFSLLIPGNHPGSRGNK